MNDLEKYREFMNSPDKYLPIDELGDFYLRKFNDRYAGLKAVKQIPLFEKAFKILSDRGCYSKELAFGEMHGDGYLWVLKHKDIKVIIEQQQSYKLVYILDGLHFHIRALDYAMNYPQYRKTELKDITETRFKSIGFKLNNTFKAFTYGDERDSGYILSMCLIKGLESIEGSNTRTINVLELMKNWEYYLDNPDELE
jgi:hypothetical protein